jgi:hypothetical protein
MAFHYSPKIVTNGLVLCLDAANTKSYVPSSTTWYDLSKSGYNGVLKNGVSYSQSNLGILNFDGSDDYISCGNENNLQITEGSVCCWVKTSGAGSGYRSIVAKQFNYGLFTDSNVLITYDWNTSSVKSTGINIADGNWKYVVLTFTENTGSPSNNAIVYLNGQSVLTATIKLNTTYIIEFQIGNGGTISGGATQHINGSISQVKIYNRVLSVDEISQNFNATKTRFGL